jgi:hypothetical protein
MRTLQQIEAQILAEKDLKPSLSALNNTSPTSIWRLFVYIVAYAIWIHEQFFGKHVIEVEGIAARAIPGTARWYQYLALQYQDGYLLEWDANAFQYKYSSIDTLAQIVKLASVKENPTGGITVKAAKLSGTTPEPLTAPELSAFVSYINDIKFAGTFVTVISENADDIKIYADIYYNGTQLLSNVKLLVEAAINNYLLNLPFDGLFQLSKLQDAIQAVPGIEDVSLTSVEARFGVSAYQNVSLDYYPYSGYLKIPNIAPLSTTLQYYPR